MSWPKRCARCTHPMYPRTRKLAPAMSHGGRGLCTPCYDKCRKAGELDDYTKVTHSRDELLDAWEELRLHGYSKRQAAEHLLMSYEAFERAFLRAREDEDPRAINGWNDRLRKPKRHNRSSYCAGCRCDQCREANTAYYRKLREEWAARRVEIDGRLVAAWLPDDAHGTDSAYRNFRCRCLECIDAGAQANARTNARRNSRVAS